jgi:hypothetical protein
MSSSTTSSSESVSPSFSDFKTWALTHESSNIRAYATDGTLSRYLRAHNNNLTHAKRGLEATVLWRETSISSTFVCAPCKDTNGAAHCFIPLGTDASGATIVYGCPARASAGGEVTHTLAHCVNALEKQWTSCDNLDNHGSRQWVWIVDFKGFGLTHSMNARLGIAFASVFRDHFPERLSSIILINPPFIFKALIAAIGAIADARTLAKLHQVDVTTGTHAITVLKETYNVIDTNILDWLLAVFDAPHATPGTLPPLPKDACKLQV